jgi:hypothetical protein
MSRWYSTLTFLGLVACLILVKVILEVAHFPPETFPHPAQLTTFQWPFIAGVGVAGLVGVLLARLTGFPEMWDPKVSQFNRFILPAVLGLAFGFAEVAADKQFGMAQLFVEKFGVPFFHIKFPASALIYPGGAITIEVLYRLVPIPLVMGLVFLIGWGVSRCLGARNVLLARPAQERLFWIVASVLSLFEPVTQTGIIGILRGHGMMSGHGDVVAYEFVTSYAFNLIQAYLFRRFGFLAPVTMRVAMYLVWHVLWGYISQT